MLGFRSRKSAESIAAIEMTPAAAPARAPRLAEHAAAVWQAMNTALYVALLDAAEAELKRCGYSPVYGCLHQQSVASPVRVAVGKAIYQARLKHIAPLIGPNALARAVEQSESGGDALAWADGTLGRAPSIGGRLPLHDRIGRGRKRRRDFCPGPRVLVALGERIPMRTITERDHRSNEID